jgi:uncharacterized protein YabE (DUF348 family)
VEALLNPAPDVDAPGPRDLPVANPSPARAAPHDAAAWFPLPDLEPEADGDRGASGRHHRVHVPNMRGPVRVALAITVAVALGGAALYARANIFDAGSRVDLRVDGRSIEAVTGVSTIGGLLVEEGITLSPYDRVRPGLGAPIEDGMTVRVLRAFGVGVNFDGTARTVHTTKTEPKDFLKDATAELHLGPQVVMLSQPQRITKTTNVVLRTKHTGTLAVDGQTVTFTDAPTATVREVLDRYGILPLASLDVTAPGIDSPMVDGTHIVVTRIAAGEESADEPYSVPDERRPDADLEVGKTRVQDAVPGIKHVTYRFVRNNGIVVEKRPISQIPTQLATPRITFFGTKANPYWDKMAECETGGNWAAPGPTYQGGLGIWYGNWTHYGGRQFAPTAGQATREEQIIVAERIRAEHGWHAWGCAKVIGL